MNTPLQPFEPDRLIRLVYAQYPHRTDVLRALQLCSSGYWENEKYIYFIQARQLSSTQTKINIVESLIVDDQNKGQIVVDVVDDGRIAGINYSSGSED
jgi:hypothetical protein